MEHNISKNYNEIAKKEHDFTYGVKKVATYGQQPDGDYVIGRSDGKVFSTSTNLGSTQLNGAINDSVTTITVDSTATFPASGQVRIIDELITYTGKTATTFTGCTRGAEGTTAVSHNDNDVVGEVYISDWYDLDGFGMLEFFFTSDVPSANKGILIEWTDDAQATTPIKRASEFYEYIEPDVRLGYKDLHIRPKLDGFRILYTNGGEAQTTVYISTVGRVSPEVGFENTGNAIVVSDFAREIALGNVSNYSQNTKFGRNPEVDQAQGADVWSGGTAALGQYEYTGFNATQNENIETLSTNAADAGTLVSSGTVTTSSSTALIDSNATFITDGVAVGDIILNDTRSIYGYVTAVDSETQLSLFKMQDGVIGQFANIAGNEYRIATTASTGAAVVQWSRVLDSNYEKQGNVFVILNGLTGVTTSINAYRLSRGKVLLSGSAGENVGRITCRQAVTTANVFCVITPGTNQTLICADTVPAREVYLLESVSCSISVTGGTAVGAEISLRTRPFGGSFNTIRVYDVAADGGAYQDTEIGGITVGSGTDFKLSVDSVSANNVRVSGKIEYLEIDEI